jgi:hypothetical protein
MQNAVPCDHMPRQAGIGAPGIHYQALLGNRQFTRLVDFYDLEVIIVFFSLPASPEF